MTTDRPTPAEREIKLPEPVAELIRFRRDTGEDIVPCCVGTASQHVHASLVILIEPLFTADQLRAAMREDRQAAQEAATSGDAARWRALYLRAVNEANGLTNYVEDRPELRSAERRLDAAIDQAMKGQP